MKRLCGLSLEQRQKIQEFIKTPMTFVEMSPLIGKSKSTIAAEVKSNGGRLHYNAHEAQARADKKKSNSTSTEMPIESQSNLEKSLDSRVKSLEMQVQILSETLKELLDAKHN